MTGFSFCVSFDGSELVGDDELSLCLAMIGFLVSFFLVILVLGKANSVISMDSFSTGVSALVLLSLFPELVMRHHTRLSSSYSLLKLLNSLLKLSLSQTFLLLLFETKSLVVSMFPLIDLMWLVTCLDFLLVLLLLLHMIELHLFV